MAAAAVAACETRVAIDEPVSADGSYIYTLSATAPEITRSDYTDAGQFSWTEGDKISVLFHNGNDNKFFTFATSSIDGASATFVGQIESGYEIGASTDGTKWALYPAGEHGVRFDKEDAEKFPLSFNIPAVTDYTKDGFSAGIPMYAQGDANNIFEFMHLGAAYKFTFTDIEASKVKLLIENQTTYQLSGNIKLRNQDGTYLDQGWGEGADKTLAYISNVTDGKAVFYVPVRYYAACFQPIITLCDDETGDQIYTRTAASAKAIESKGHVQPINISVSGAVVVPWSFPSDHGIDWNSVTTSADGRSDAPYDGIKVIKATGDASNLYVYFEVAEDALIDNAGYDYANYCYMYLGNADSAKPYDWQWTGNYTDKISSWIKVSNNLSFTNWKSYSSFKIDTHNGAACFEVTLSRSGLACLQGTSATVAVEINSIYLVDGNDWGTQGGSTTQIGFAPSTGGSALEVSLPAYVE